MTRLQAESVPPVSLLGIGAITPLGRGLDAIAAKLATWQESSAAKILRVNDDLLSDPALSRQLRRADRFTRMAAMAALDAWNASESSRADVAPERIGMIVSSGFGPHCRGFRFLDGILDCGDDAASPTDFSHSVHGAASAYISGLLGLRGPSLNVTDFEIGFEETLRLAQCWLAEGACDRVLVGAVEELGEVMLDCASKMLGNFPGLSPGEGAVFLMLGPGKTPGVARLEISFDVNDPDLLIVEEPPIIPGSTRSPQSGRTISFGQALGQSASASAFALLGGLLALQGKLPGRETVDNVATFGTSSDRPTLLLSRGDL